MLKIYQLILGSVLFAMGMNVSSMALEKLPEACQQQCKQKYGVLLGKTANGVEAYSNCSEQCVVFEPHHVKEVYTGIRWQCVEFARRWLYLEKGLVYGDVDVAADIWSKIKLLKVPGTEQTVPLHKYLNGHTSLPNKGDLLIYGREFLGTGHVAVVVAVDSEKGRLRVAEQNYLNQPWPADYAREIPLIQKNGGYWLLDPHIIGWARAGQSP